MVLGSPWLASHNRQIDWANGTITAWSAACQSRCLRSAFLPSPLHLTFPSVAVDRATAPQVYHDLGEVFSNQGILSLPPHLPYHCAFDLRPVAKLPSSRLYQLSRPEHEAP